MQTWKTGSFTLLGPLSELAFPFPASLPSLIPSPQERRTKPWSSFYPKKKKSRSIDVTCIKKENAYLIDLLKVKHVFL